MVSNDSTETALETLQQLGLKEYEADCFVGLSRVENATAKELSEITDVPRTRVYDAIRVLEAEGLVETHHTTPKRFRAVPVEEAVATLQGRYESRLERLEDALRAVEPAESARESLDQEVWSLTGSDAIANRTRQLLSEADEEVVLVIGEETLFTTALADALNGLPEGVDLFVGVLSEQLEEQVAREVPDATVFVSELEWLRGGEGPAIGRLLLVDRSALLVSSYDPGEGAEQAVFGTGFGNGLVVVTRRLLSTGLLGGGQA